MSETERLAKYKGIELTKIKEVHTETYKFIAKTKADKKTLRDGDIPHKVRIVQLMLEQQGARCGRYRWYEEPEFLFDVTTEKGEQC